MSVQEADDQLIERCLRGQREAFDHLVQRYQDRLYHSIYHLLGTVEDAQDIVQDSFVRAYQRLDTFQGGSAFYTWLYRIAVNMAISWKRRHRITISLDHRLDRLGQEPADPADDASPSMPMERRERARQVQEALQGLPEEYRVVLVLKEVDGLKYEAIAEIVGCPVGTVRSRLHRARVEFRERLKAILEMELR